MNMKLYLKKQIIGIEREFDVEPSIIFIDPPYNKENINQILLKIIKNKIKLNDTVIVIEIEKNQQIKIPEGLVVWKERIYGKTKLLFLN